MSGFINIVEGMEEFLLGLGLSCNELYVVYQKQIGISVFCSEILSGPFSYRFDELVCKLVAFYIDYFFVGISVVYCGPDGKQKVCLSETGIAVNKKGIVCYIVVVGDSLGSCMGEFAGSSLSRLFWSVYARISASEHRMTTSNSVENRL